MSPKLSKLQNFKTNFKDPLLKYIVVKFHNFTLSINHTVSNWKWGRWKLGWVYMIFICHKMGFTFELFNTRGKELWHSFYLTFLLLYSLYVHVLLIILDKSVSTLEYSVIVGSHLTMHIKLVTFVFEVRFDFNIL